MKMRPIIKKNLLVKSSLTLFVPHELCTECIRDILVAKQVRHTCANKTPADKCWFHQRRIIYYLLALSCNTRFHLSIVPIKLK